jgi:hypothetical protein
MPGDAARNAEVRRNGGGSRDIAFYRTRARRLRRMARFQVWRGVLRSTADLLHPT